MRTQLLNEAFNTLLEQDNAEADREISKKRYDAKDREEANKLGIPKEIKAMVAEYIDGLPNPKEDKKKFLAFVSKKIKSKHFNTHDVRDWGDAIEQFDKKIGRETVDESYKNYPEKYQESKKLAYEHICDSSSKHIEELRTYFNATKFSDIDASEIRLKAQSIISDMQSLIRLNSSVKNYKPIKN